MQEVHDSKEQSKEYLQWFAEEEVQKDVNELDFNNTEDGISRKRRLQNQLAKALAVLGVKHSTFCSMLNKGKNNQVRKLLKQALKERCDFINDMEDKAEGEKKDEDGFNVNLEFADMTTVHEAYQFLMRKYVEGDEDVAAGTFIDMEELKARHQRRKSTCLDPNGKIARRNSFIAMTGIKLEDNDGKIKDAEKVAAATLDLPAASLKRTGSSKRRKSVLLGINDDDVNATDDKKDLEQSLKRQGSKRREKGKKKGGKELKRKESFLKKFVNQVSINGEEKQQKEEQKPGILQKLARKMSENQDETLVDDLAPKPATNKRRGSIFKKLAKQVSFKADD